MEFMPIIRLRPVNRCVCLRVNMIETTHTQYNIYHPFFCYDRQRTTYRYSQRRPFRRVDSLLPAVGLCPDDPRTAPCRDPGVADQPHSRRAAPCPDSCRTHHRTWRSACPHARRMASACPLCLRCPHVLRLAATAAVAGYRRLVSGSALRGAVRDHPRQRPCHIAPC